jgi:hypothetical protein
VALNHRLRAAALARPVVEEATGLRVTSLLKNISFTCPYHRCDEFGSARTILFPMDDALQEALPLDATQFLEGI